MRAALVLLVLAACGGKKSVPPPRPELVEVARDLAERVCACETDKDCLRELRAEWDAQRVDLANNHGLVGDQKAQIDAEVTRIRACGDGGGLTYWMPPPPQE